jgi:hypothetical protein
MMGTKIYIDLLKLDFEECFTILKKELKQLNAGYKLNNDETNKFNSEIKPTTKKVSENGQIENTVSSWLEVDVCNWFKKKKIKVFIKEYFTPCNGRVLKELYKMSMEMPEIFVTTILRSDLNVNLKDIAFFRVELRLLFL